MGPQQAPVARQVPVVRVMVLPAVHQVPAAPVVLVAAVVARRLFLVVHPGVRHPVNLDKIMKRSLYAPFLLGLERLVYVFCGGVASWFADYYCGYARYGNVLRHVFHDDTACAYFCTFADFNVTDH